MPKHQGLVLYVYGVPHVGWSVTHIVRWHDYNGVKRKSFGRERSSRQRDHRNDLGLTLSGSNSSGTSWPESSWDTSSVTSSLESDSSSKTEA